MMDCQRSNPQDLMESYSYRKALEHAASKLPKVPKFSFAVPPPERGPASAHVV